MNNYCVLLDHDNMWLGTYATACQATRHDIPEDKSLYLNLIASIPLCIQYFFLLTCTVLTQQLMLVVNLTT